MNGPTVAHARRRHASGRRREGAVPPAPHGTSGPSGAVATARNQYALVPWNSPQRTQRAQGKFPLTVY